jgi:hypothetical protein
MIGIITYVYDHISFGNYREFLGSQLLSNLTIGEKYFVSFFINFANYLPGCQKIASNKEGIKFSTIPFSNSDSIPINNFANLYTDSIIIDTISWYKISGSFIADSAYSYIILGNFFDDSHTDALLLWDTTLCGGSSAYYYLDDICISTDSLYNLNWTGIKKNYEIETFSLSPNPFSSQINISSLIKRETKFVLYDISARKIIEQNFITPVSINTSSLQPGLYFYELSLNNNIIQQGKLVKTKN